MIEELKRKPQVVKLFQKMHPSNSTCRICGLPWAVCEHHSIMVKQPRRGVVGRGFFPVCEWCWNHESYADNKMAVAETYIGWKKECDGTYELPFSLGEMLTVFERDWAQTHKDE